ncbi:anti-sigma F factor [Viridibacillus sp. FSL R5-0477]|uniref:Anti-sigma F factor n=2 Tax=Viridibacillus TaxID=496496 RepID=W4EKX3_9BACL|nr:MULTISPECIES: anti-sigma F factor [Viridibacillus]ETT81225.1 anti-sigma F factor [Viridibacillus arenosi FSL R5-213]KOO49185.1 anti-sigma F factor [Viridibacillus arvi]OMC84165.1 anti-sigma F factor [Viridibacillus sp. FSL H8-0123]OMC88686.1 anti-sigma F factor [Viridibacillus sp. FSL H7-0596]OMC93319.1 anti-sigma F factor [Viridibacillus arenosi]
MDNEMTLSFLAVSENEALARMAMTSFMTVLDPTIEELSEVKTVISEAVTNAIIHGYEENRTGIVTVYATRVDREVTVTISDQGCGIEDVQQAMEPLYTTKQQMDRSGMGFTIMESFTDQLSVKSERGKGTTVTFKKQFQPVGSPFAAR